MQKIYENLKLLASSQAHVLPFAQSNVEGLKEQAREMSRSHKDQLVKLRKDLTQQLEDRLK